MTLYFLTALRQMTKCSHN